MVKENRSSESDLMNSFEGSEVDSNVSNTGHSSFISGVEMAIPEEAVVHLGGHKLGQREAHDKSGAAESLAEGVPIIGQDELRLAPEVVILGVIVAGQDLKHVIHHENRVVVAHHQPPQILMLLPVHLHDRVDDPLRHHVSLLEHAGEVFGDSVRRGRGRPGEEVAGGGLVQEEEAARGVGAPPRLDVGFALVPCLL